MLQSKELTFVVFLLHALSEEWKMLPKDVYGILKKTDILDQYVIRCYDTLHTLGKEYLVEDITTFVREKGINL
ncbi:MAG: DUF3791 domain-containing protein [Thermoguttaceae bacterium]|nr:DUF3791 domain-containing protein [Thermoguttaceae bacterium]